MTTDSPAIFDVHLLLERSVPRPGRMRWLRWTLLGITAATVALLLATRDAPSARSVAWAINVLFLLVLVGAVAFATWAGIRALRDEQARLDDLERCVTLRQWPAAAALAQDLLRQPMRTHGGRAQALMLLASVLLRYHRFGDAIEVHDYLLGNVEMEPSMAFSLRTARAMAMIRDDRLVDADRALNELRRFPGASDTAALALVEIYRDVKTGHHDEAIECFRAKQAQFGLQLGHRASDAWALVAVSMAARGDEAGASEAVRNATLLAPPVEVARRYPEFEPLLKRFPVAAAPPEAA
jgi:tetratricopeptide (TPR) repeat protein